jgi:hypothetical protein
MKYVFCVLLAGIAALCFLGYQQCKLQEQLWVVQRDLSML